MQTEYTTLVFKSDTPQALAKVREMANQGICEAWSRNHELLRLDLIEQALDENDIEKAKSYIGVADVSQFKDRLDGK